MINHGGVVYRVTAPKWAVDPTSGEGARLSGGRFNRVGLPALYTSLEHQTAVEEFRQNDPIMPPNTSTALVVDCDHIIDLTDPVELSRRGITFGDLDCAWKLLAAMGTDPLTWKLADTLISEGYSGMKVHSFARRVYGTGRNLVLWKWSDAKPYQVRKHDPSGALPKDQTSFT